MTAAERAAEERYPIGPAWTASDMYHRQLGFVAGAAWQAEQSSALAVEKVTGVLDGFFEDDDRLL